MTAIFVIGFLLALLAAKHASNRYQAAVLAGSKRRMPGAQTAQEVAREFLNDHSLPEVQIMEHNAMLSNYYDPKRKTLFLTKSTMQGTDAASWAEALHEAAHSLQYTGDAAKALRWRLGNIQLTRYAPALVGLICLVLIVLKRVPSPLAFRAFTGLCMVLMLLNVLSMPVEFNASRRALVWLEDKLSAYPDTISMITPILNSMAWRDTAVFLRSPVYTLHALLPVGGKRRPSK